MRTRLAAAFAAIALAVSGFATAPAAASTPPGAGYVALGDSVASGNGVLPYLDTDCLRSERSYPELLAEQLGVAVVSAACSGSTTLHTLAQVEKLHDAYALGPATELVTLTVGVNDTAWQLALLVCSDAPNARSSPLPMTCAQALGLVEQMITAGLSERIAAVIQAVRGYAPQARIVVTGYPLPFGDENRTCHLGLLEVRQLGIRRPVSFDAAATAAINQAALSLNEAIDTGVTLSGDSNAIYVDVNGDVKDASGNVVAEGFDGHGLCDSEDRWMSGFLPAQAQTTDRGFHPNAAGQAAYANIIASVIDG